MRRLGIFIGFASFFMISCNRYSNSHQNKDRSWHSPCGLTFAARGVISTTMSNIPEPTAPLSAYLTTTFTPPAACATQLVDRNGIRLNPMFPPLDPAATSCYAPEFIQFWTMKGFDKLVCPESYSTVASAAGKNYIVCCPECVYCNSLLVSLPLTLEQRLQCAA